MFHSLVHGFDSPAAHEANHRLPFLMSSLSELLAAFFSGNFSIYLSVISVIINAGQASGLLQASDKCNTA